MKSLAQFCVWCAVIMGLAYGAIYVQENYIISAPQKYTNQSFQTAYENGYKLSYAEQRDLHKAYKEGYDEKDKQYTSIEEEFEHQVKKFQHNNERSDVLDAYGTGLVDGTNAYLSKGIEAAKSQKFEPSTTTMMAPDKSIENVPQDKVKEYANKGYKVAFPCKHSDGTVEWNPIDKASEITGCQ